MSSPEKELSAAVFKARCLALMDEVAATGISIIVTKRGKPVARLVPLEEQEPVNLLDSVTYSNEEDLMAPVDASWEALK